MALISSSVSSALSLCLSFSHSLSLGIIQPPHRMSNRLDEVQGCEFHYGWVGLSDSDGLPDSARVGPGQRGRPHCRARRQTPDARRRDDGRENSMAMASGATRLACQNSIGTLTARAKSGIQP
ncbi:hypothetical protein IWX49DRAFT_559627 [Phyllosticta citricarpa]